MLTMHGGRPDPDQLGRRPTVLIVEDDTAIRGLIAELLIGEGYAVIEAADSREGLRCARQLGPDLILLDLGLPLADGLEVLETLRSGQETRHIPVVVVTGHHALSSSELYRSAGLIQKPFDLANLLEHVRRLTNRGPDRAPGQV
jgi:DNA-binding response OmpR family regulator